jgi:hypothetical protein
MNYIAKIEGQTRRHPPRAAHHHGGVLNQKDYKRTEELLREVDFYLSQVVVKTKVVR